MRARAWICSLYGNTLSPLPRRHHGRETRRRRTAMRTAVRLHRLVLKARDLDSRRAPHASNRVQNRGDRLSKIYWKGRQWAATKFGVQCRDGSYSIDRRRVWEDEERGGWVMHMAEKDWVDL